MKSFQQTQAEFVKHIREPDSHSCSMAIEDRRLKIYRELFFNNILGFLNSGFPVLSEVYGESKWHKLARKFFLNHHCRSPYFVDISKEFVEYLANEHEVCDDDPAFFKELAHYEWLELDISIRKTQQKATLWDGESSLKYITMSDAATLAGYQFPVHQISSRNFPDKSSEPVFVVVYRKADYEVGFTVVNAVTAHLLDIFTAIETPTCDEIMKKMIEALPQIPQEQVETGVDETLKQLLLQQILLIPTD